jgi:molybdopterin/thiamine biosynthesis adenylyltransferase/rhodanese-related sulfurtransferase/molybdopterin converting factor small subunit
MTRVTVRLPMPLRRFTDGAAEVTILTNSVGAALVALTEIHPETRSRLFSPQGEVRRFVKVFLDDEDISNLSGLETALTDGSVLSIILAVSGGAGYKGLDCRLRDLTRDIRQISPSEAEAEQRRGGVLLDVRESDEIAQGSPRDAKRIGRSYLELRIEDAAPDLTQPLLVMCASGTRSLFAADDLLRLGYRDVRSVSGGFNRWKSEGLPVELPQILGSDDRERYSRHLLMPEVGEAGQIKLQKSRVLLVGAGGLGSPAALYLAAAGVGTIGIVDNDKVERSNLQRQILHTDARVGTAKVESARDSLLAINPSIKVNAHPLRLDRHNVEELFAQYQIVVDGSDNFTTHYLVNDACVKLGLPEVHGAVFRFEGQVTVFWPRNPKQAGPCYRCIFPEPPPPELAPSCAEAGVLGVLPGVVGLLQAVEVVKLLLELGNSLVGRMIYYDALRGMFSELKLRRDPNCRFCADGVTFPGYEDYEMMCNAV